MIEKIIAGILARLSEELLDDLIKHIAREVLIGRKKSNVREAAGVVKDVIAEVVEAKREGGMTDAEIDAELIAAGRDLINRLRDNKST